MSLEFTSQVIQVIGAALLLVTAAIIIAARKFLDKQASLDLTALNKSRKWKSPLEGRNKYPEVDLFRFRGIFLEYGMLFSLGAMILAFSWTTYEAGREDYELLQFATDEIEMQTPRTTEPPSLPPPPSVAAMSLVVSELPDIGSVVFEDMSVDESSEVSGTPEPMDSRRQVVAPAPPPSPPAMDEAEREIFRVVEQNPMFPGCEGLADKSERQVCADEKLLQFIYGNIIYPQMARENGIEGMVVVQFIVETDGSVSNAVAVRDIGGGCGDEALRVVNMMPPWNPGRQRERPVRVMFTLPVKFKLE